MGSEQGINVSAPPAAVLVMKSEDGGLCCKEQQQLATEERPAARENAVDHHAERKPAEDPTAIIESLRARLLSERNASRSAKQQVQQLARKVKELERRLGNEVQKRGKCEQRIQQLLSKLEAAGIEVPVEDEDDEDNEDQKSEEKEQGKQLKPNWIITRTRRHSLEANLADLRSRSSNNMEVEHENISIGSPSSDPGSSSAQRRVGRSCRTIRPRETDNELEIDELVKGAWRKVGEDIIELAKLRNGDSGETSSDMFESNQDNSENGEVTSDAQEKQAEADGHSSTADPQGNGSNEQEAVVGSTEAQQVSLTHTEAQVPLENAEVQSRSKTADVETKAESSTERTEGTSQTPKDSTISRSQQLLEQTRPHDDVEEVLKALELAKQQLKQAHFHQQHQQQQPFSYSNTSNYYTAPTPSLSFLSQAPFPGSVLRTSPPIFTPAAYPFFTQQSGPSITQQGYVSTARFASAEDVYHHSHNGGPRLYYVDKLNVAGDLRYYAP